MNKRLQEYDERYQDYNQTEREDSRILKAKGHPNAKEYRALRDFFDTLKHFANSGARFYSFVSDDENTQYWAPELSIRRLLLYPSDDGYIEYLKGLDISQSDTYLDAGSWTIDTQNEEFFNAIEALQGKAGINVSYKDVPAGHKRATWIHLHNAYNHFSATIYLDTKEQFDIVKAVIDRFVTPFLPTREDSEG